MCGIAGIVNHDGSPASRERLQAMVSAEAHRGPDGEGIRIEGAAGIGHRRLSIIDLELGRQPMGNEDGSAWITYNGELYNFAEIRETLESRGYSFRTRSDTEVVLRAYEAFGDDCVLRFRGMFAFGILDLRSRRLFLARDHFGIKPLVYYSDARGFAFASEIRALRQAGDAELTLDLASLDQYLKLQYIPAPASIYTRVRKLPPAHRMSVSFDGNVSEPDCYWRPAFGKGGRAGEAALADELDHALRESVRSHLVSDVPVGAFLSGGVDSSAVVAYMAQAASGPVKTFSIGFDDAEFNELPYAAEVAARWGTDHHSEIVRADALALLPDLVEAFGEPFGDSSAIPTYHVSRLARRSVPVALSGDGGDESFAGYHSYANWMAYLEGDPSARRPAWKRLLRPAASAFFPRRYPRIPARGSSLGEWLGSVSVMPDALRREIWRPEHRALVDGPIGPLELEYGFARRYGGACAAQLLDFRSYLPGCILTKVDIAGMMSGLEVRTPLLDTRLQAMVAGIPERLNIRKNEQGVWEGKRLLKKTLSRYYPESFLRRRKRGFSLPLRKWLFGTGDTGIGDVSDRLFGTASTLREFFDMAALRRFFEKGDPAGVWLLLFLEEWLRQDGRRA